MSLAKLADPRYVGPGGWFSIHTMARFADTPDKKRCFVVFMREFCREFRCGECSGHCQKYLQDHPIEPYFNLRSSRGEEIGCFKWSWMFHNAVNNRLGKPIVDWKTAYEMYFTREGPGKVCTAGCGDSGAHELDEEDHSESQQATYEAEVIPYSRIKGAKDYKKVSEEAPVVYILKGEAKSSKKESSPRMGRFVGRY